MAMVGRPLPLRASAGSARRSSYFNASRSPRYSVLFALPLLLGYEALAAALAKPGKAELRNGADAILRGAFTAIAGPHGALIFMTAIILLGVWLVVRDMRLSKDRLRWPIFAFMLAEATVLAVVFGFVIGMRVAGRRLAARAAPHTCGRRGERATAQIEPRRSIGGIFVPADSISDARSGPRSH